MFLNTVNMLCCFTWYTYIFNVRFSMH